MGVLIDTNVLLRRAEPDHASNRAATESVARLLEAGEQAYLTTQNVAEFWNVATRPAANNGLGLSLEFVFRDVEILERELRILPDDPEIYHEWKRLVIAHRVTGVKVHDAGLVAAMRVHRVERILTSMSKTSSVLTSRLFIPRL